MRSDIGTLFPAWNMDKRIKRRKVTDALSCVVIELLRKVSTDRIPDKTILAILS